MNTQKSGRSKISPVYSKRELITAAIYWPYDGVQCPGKEDEHLWEKKGEMVEAKLPADDGADHEEPRTTEDDRGEEEDDLGVRRRRCVWREGEL